MKPSGSECQRMCYRKSAVRLDEGITVDLYGPLEKTHPVTVSETGRVSWQGRAWHVGDAFVGQAVVFEPREEECVVGVRFANLVLGEIGGECPYGRIRPTAFKKRRGEWDGDCILRWFTVSQLAPLAVGL